MNTWKTILAVSLIFVAGLASGIALAWKLWSTAQDTPQAQRSDAPPFQPWQLRDRYVDFLAKKLELNPDQKEAISTIVSESQQRTKILFELVGPEMREEMNQVRDAIRAQLSPAQQSEFDSLQHRHKRPHKNGENSKPDPDPNSQPNPKADGGSPLEQKCEQRNLLPWDSCGNLWMI